MGSPAVDLGFQSDAVVATGRGFWDLVGFGSVSVREVGVAASIARPSA